MTTPDQLAEVERWFVRRGVPHFIDHYTAVTDIWTRALPPLSLLLEHPDDQRNERAHNRRRAGLSGEIHGASGQDSVRWTRLRGGPNQDVRWAPSRAFQAIAPGDHFEFAADGFLHRDDRPRLEDEGRKHRAELVNGHRVVAL